MISFKLFFEKLDSRMIVYHVTSRRYLNAIKQNGIIPKIPEDYSENGDEVGVYCFPNLDEAENALYNWLGERIEDWEEENQMDYDECVLKIDITGLNVKEEHGIDWEIIVKDVVTPDRILEVLGI